MEMVPSGWKFRRVDFTYIAVNKNLEMGTGSIVLEVDSIRVFKLLSTEVEDDSSLVSIIRDLKGFNKSPRGLMCSLLKVNKIEGRVH